MSRKQIILVSILAALMATSGAQANMSGIAILSEEYHVWGGYWTSSGLSDSYDLTSSSDLTDSFLLELPNELVLYAGSSAGELFVYANAGHIAFDYDLHGPLMAYAYSRAWLLFQPIAAGTLVAEFLGFREYAPCLEITLMDTTAGTILLNRWGQVISESYMWSVDATHTYGLSIYADATTYPSTDNDSVHAYITANLTVIPAPGAIVLGSIGAGLVGLLRRRKAL